MKRNILHSYEMLTSDLLISLSALEIVYRWLDELQSDKLGYYEFSEFKGQYADILNLAILHLNNLSSEHQKIVSNQVMNFHKNQNKFANLL